MNIRKSSIELQLIKPVKGATNSKGRVNLLDLQKDLLDELHVAYADMCCPVGNQIPNGAPVRFANGDLEYFDVTTNAWVDATPAIVASRFGVAGEDDVAGENRQFELDGFTLIFQSGAGNGTYAEFRGDSPNSSNIFFQATNQSDTNDFSYIDISTSIGGTSIDLYLQRNSGNDWGEFYLTDNSLYIAHSADLDIETGSGDIYMRLSEGDGIRMQVGGGTTLFRLLDGTGIYAEVDAGETLQIVGVVQDDTATQMMALDAGNNVVWVDKATISGGSGSPTVLRPPLPFFASGAGMGGAGSVFYAITNLTTLVPANTRGKIEVLLYIFDNSSGLVEDYLLEADQFVAQGNVVYELLGRTNVAGVPNAIIKGGDQFDPDGDFLGSVTYNAADWGTEAFHIMRVTANFVTGGIDTNFTMKLGTFSGIGSFSVQPDSFMEVTLY
jgi:hypothetical protein